MIRGVLADWLPAALAFAGTLAPALLASGRLTRGRAQAVVLTALVSLAAFGALVVLWPLGDGEAGEARLYPALDAALGVALVALAALGVRRPYVVALWSASALVLARAGGLVASALAADMLTTAVLTGALFWLGAAMLAAALGVVRWRVAPLRQTP